MLMRNQLYAGIVDVPEYGIRGKRGDFEPLISEDLLYRCRGAFLAAAEHDAASPRSPLTFRCARSSVARRVGAASPVAGRKGRDAAS